jgi:predicted dehydrogenase
MDKVRLGIIGMGNIGRYHAAYLQKGEVPRCELVAVCARNTSALEEFKAFKIFSDAEALIGSGEVDAVIIGTPHYQHAPIGIAAIEAGVHVMVEKPIAAHKADAQRLINAHLLHPRVVFAGMFQQRVEPRYLKIRELITSGDLGSITRINWINTDWYRTDAYYNSADWRGTWKGEGGGVLLNQCLHNLDMLQWLCGMPARVRGFCQLGRFHPIEVEDNVTAYMEWQNGATGTFIGSTGETPGTNRLEIVGTRGRVILEHNRLTFASLAEDMRTWSKTAAQGFVAPEATTSEIPIENASGPHAVIMRNFTAAILDGEPLLVRGEEGMGSLELANAMVYSSMLDRPIDLPMSGAAWETKLEELIAESKITKQVKSVNADDFVSSFRR